MSLHARAILVVVLTPFIIAGLTAIAGFDGIQIAGLPLFAVCIIVVFLIQWIVFIHAHLAQTERFFDLVGSLTFISVAITAAVLGAAGDPRSYLLAALVLIWAGRLGSFLFVRVSKAGHDSRFARIVPDFRVHLMTWTLQGIWVSITVTCALVAITSTNKVPLDAFAAVGLLMWITGFAIEVIADNQKTAFRKDPANEGRFITTGLWSWSRHPNYFGEIILWAGVAIIAIPVFEGFQYLALLSPAFVVIQMTKISGVDMLERKNDRTWRDDPDYLAYKERTSKLVMMPPAKA